VGLFDTLAMKDLKKQAEQIGILYGQARTGRLSEADRDDAVQNDDIRAGLRQAYEAASKDVGSRQALKAAMKSARDQCDAICYVSSRHGGPPNYDDARRAAEEAVRGILAPQVPGGRPVPVGRESRPASRGPARVNSDRPVLTINGRPQATPETPDTIERRVRLYIECERRLVHDPFVLKFTHGHMVGRGSGLDGIVSKIAPLFKREQSLIRWVALRGAIACLWMSILDPEMSSKSPEDLASVMGFTWVDSAGRPYADSSQGQVFFAANEVPGQLSGQLRKAAADTAGTVMKYAVNYQRFVDMSIYDADADALFSEMSDAVALECIAWSAVARLRLGVAQLMFTKVPEPDALSVPGWYFEPVTAVCQRYWDGTDWTSACRNEEGRRFKEFTLPLRPRRKRARDMRSGRDRAPALVASTPITSPSEGKSEISPFGGEKGSACPICGESLGRAPDLLVLAEHNLRHVIPSRDGGPGYEWQCSCGEVDGIWNLNMGAAGGLAQHMQQRHGLI
jgi:Protein of unknown function (DUF2510)